MVNWTTTSQRQERINKLKKLLKTNQKTTKNDIHIFGLSKLGVGKRCIDIYIAELELLGNIEVQSADHNLQVVRYHDSKPNDFIIWKGEGGC